MRRRTSPGLSAGGARSSIKIFSRPCRTAAFTQTVYKRVSKAEERFSCGKEKLVGRIIFKFAAHDLFDLRRERRQFGLVLKVCVKSPFTSRRAVISPCYLPIVGCINTWEHDYN